MSVPRLCCPVISTCRPWSSLCLLLWNLAPEGVRVKVPQRSLPLPPCQSAPPSCGPASCSLLAKMSDKGLSDEAAATACKDGDPITKVRRELSVLKLNFFHAPWKPASPTGQRLPARLTSYARCVHYRTETRFFTKCPPVARWQAVRLC